MSRKLALLVGNSIFHDRILSRLQAPISDLDALAEVLENPNIGNFDNVELLQNDSLSKVQIEVARFFKRRKSTDLLLLYFSGHGILDFDGSLYFAVSNTEHNLLSGTALSSSFISKEMDNCMSKRQVLILDCCHGGAFERAKNTIGSSVNTQSTFTGQGRIVLTATDTTQYALDGDSIHDIITPSVYTKYLIRGLRTGEADLDNDGSISLEELYTYTYDKVIADDTTTQTPLKFGKQKGTIIIAQNPSVKKKINPIEIIKHSNQVPNSHSIDPLQTSKQIYIHPKSGKEIVKIPAGEFLFGKNKMKIFLPEFWIDKSPVTYAEFAKYNRAIEFSSSIANHPIKVWEYTAKAYAKWVGGRLPTEQEWEKAARGTDGRSYPWGEEEPTKELCKNGSYPVGLFSPAGDSPYGCTDMIGCVEEWTSSGNAWWQAYFQDKQRVRKGRFLNPCWDSDKRSAFGGQSGFRVVFL